ncbi:hypothetical protein NHJ13051_005363 [Beauveria bassiana]
MAQCEGVASEGTCSRRCRSVARFVPCDRQPTSLDVPEAYSVPKREFLNQFKESLARSEDARDCETLLTESSWQSWREGHQEMDALPPPYLDFALACLASAASSKTPHESDGIPILSTTYFDIGIRLYILTLEADNREARTMESVIASALIATYGLLSADLSAWSKSSAMLMYSMTIARRLDIFNCRSTGVILEPTTDNYDETCRWYQQHFNFVPTDVLHAPGDKAREVANFMRVERGKTFVDHHSFLLARGDDGKGTKVHHSSFEVEDIDTQMMTHQWLGQTGWTLVWGVGRHVHGSQIFDYWYDSSGYIIEHYADGDVVNQDTETTCSPAGAMAVWRPPVPAVWGGKASAVSG